MTRHPLINAAAAFAYIAGIAALLFYGLAGRAEGLIVPVTLLSLLVLSVLMMGFTLLLAPLRLFFEQKTHEGSVLFVKTLAAFAGITAAVITSALLFFR